MFSRMFTFVVILILLIIDIPIITISDNTSNAIYVDDDNTSGPWDGSIEHPYQHIQDAIDNASNGDTIFVFNGIYYENIVVNKSIDLIGEDKNTTIIHGYLPGEEEFPAIVLFPVNNTTISGFTIENATVGITAHSMYHKNANNCSISNIIFRTKEKCGVDILLEGSTNMKIHDNIMNHGMYISNSFNNIIERNSVGGKPLVYLENKSNQTITNAGQVILNRCENITVMNLEISDVYCGIQLYESDYTYIYNNSLCSNCFGIDINSKYNIIERNTIKLNDCGILLRSYKWNKIFHNNFINNSNNAEGFFSSNNLWYDPLTKTGNYWSDYNGTDENNDGIGDTPYNVWENEQDLYPLMNPWNKSISPFVVYVDDDYDSSTPGWGYDRFNKIQDAINVVSICGIVYVYDGIYHEHIIINKTINLIGEDRDTIIDGNYTGNVVNITASEVSIEEFTIIHSGGDWWYNAVEVYHSDNITISNLNIYLNNGAGVNLYFSNNSIIYNCNISDSGVGIHLPYSPNTVIDNCTITNCESGINVSSDADYTRIINCSISNNSYFGIFLAYAEGFIVTNCEIKYNDVGIAIWPCNLSIIKNCHISNNEYGIYIPPGNEIGGEKYNYNNNIYLNNFINNTYNVYSNNSSNIWNTPFKMTYIYNNSIYTGYLGNYWDDYNGVDANGDGIGDTPYNISSIGEDVYPLIAPFESYNISNRPPIANFTFKPMEPLVGETVIFNASNSYDIDGIVVNYTWFFSDNSIVYGMIISHVFTESGTYNVTLQVIDDKGWMNDTTKLIAVLPSSDIIPPSTTLLVGNPNYGGSWVTSHTVFNLTAVDNSSGVNETYYRIWYNGSWRDWIKYKGVFYLIGEGKHYLEYYSVDNAGNNETIHNKTFYVDDTPPITTLSIGNPIFEDTTNIYVTSDTNFYLSSHDKPSLYNVGFNNTYYRIWNKNSGWSNWMRYQSSFTVTIEGEHYIEYYGIDYLGNKEDIHNTSFYVDTIPPTTNGYGYYPIHLDSKDTGVGFYNIHYRYKIDDNGSWSEWFVGGLNENITLWISNDNKSIYVDYYAVDILDNMEDIHHDVFKILRKPHADFSYSQYGKNVYFNASSSYDEDGYIVYYNWSFGDAKYGNGIKVNHSYPTYTTYNVTLTVTDDDGLTSNITKSIHLVDNIPPDVTYISVTPIRQKPGGFVNISAEITDDSGVQEVQLILTYPDGDLENISIKNNKIGFNIYYYNHTYTEKGEYNCYFWVIDIYGNIGISDIRYFEIEEELEANIDAPNSGWLNIPIYFHGSANGGKPPYSYHWDFGDGSNSTEQNPMHAYITTGIYTVTLTVEDSRYITTSVTKTITIMRDNTPPTINIIKPGLGIYYKNKLLTNFLLSIVIGDIDIEVEVSDRDTGIDRVEFYIDDVLKTTITSPPYIYSWNEKNEYWFKHIHTIKTIAYDKAGNIDSDTVVVWRFH